MLYPWRMSSLSAPAEQRKSCEHELCDAKGNPLTLAFVAISSGEEDFDSMPVGLVVAELALVRVAVSQPLDSLAAHFAFVQTEGKIITRVAEGVQATHTLFPIAVKRFT